MPPFLVTLNKALQESNGFVAGIMVVAIAWGFFLLAHSLDTSPPKSAGKAKLPLKLYPGFPSALLCWLMWWLILLVVYSLIHDVSTYWKILLLLDGFGNIALLAAAFCLLPEEKALPKWKFVGYILVGALTLLSWNLLLGGPQFPNGNQGWRLFVSAPGILLAMGAFLLLAFTAAKRFTEFKIQIWLLCVLYALLQVPAYIYLLVDWTPNLKERDIVRSLLAIGKIMFVLLFLSILLFKMRISTMSRIAKFLVDALKIILLLLAFISAITPLFHN